MKNKSELFLLMFNRTDDKPLPELKITPPPGLNK